MPQFDAIDVGKLMRNVPPPTLLNAPCARQAHPENRRRRDAEIYVSFGPSATDLTTRRRRGVPSAPWRPTSFGTGAAAGVRAEAKLLGDVEAASEEEARRLARDRWPGLPLLFYVQRDDRPGAPPRGTLW